MTKHLRLRQRIVFKIKHSKTISSLGKFPKNQLTPNGLPAHQIKQNTKDKLSQANMIWDLENKFVSILEDDKEWEEKKLRKAEYEAGKTDGIEIAEERMIHNMIKLDFPIEKIAEVTGKSPLEIEQYLQSNRQ